MNIGDTNTSIPFTSLAGTSANPSAPRHRELQFPNALPNAEHVCKEKRPWTSGANPFIEIECSGGKMLDTQSVCETREALPLPLSVFS